MYDALCLITDAANCSTVDFSCSRSEFYIALRQKLLFTSYAQSSLLSIIIPAKHKLKFSFFYTCHLYRYYNFMQSLYRNALGKQALLKWWHGDGGMLDYSNPEAVSWWHTQMDKVRWGEEVASLSSYSPRFLPLSLPLLPSASSPLPLLAFSFFPPSPFPLTLPPSHTPHSLSLSLLSLSPPTSSSSFSSLPIIFSLCPLPTSFASSPLSFFLPSFPPLTFPSSLPCSSSLT